MTTSILGMFPLAEHPKLYVAPSAIHGTGVYSRAAFGGGDIIFRLFGSYRHEQYDEDYYVGPDWFSVGLGCWLIPHEHNPECFLNHSCDANTRLRDDLAIVALRSIAPGNEIVIDYSTTELDPHWRMQCRCGGKTCRGIVKPFYQVFGPARQSILSATPDMLRRCVARLRITSSSEWSACCQSSSSRLWHAD